MASRLVNPKFVEEQARVLRLRLAHNHPSDEDLSPGTPVTRQSPLLMNKKVE
jgi:hypothetical protein